MTELAALLARTVLIGLLATAVMDLWALLRRRWFGLPLPDYGLVGRWLRYCLRGHFRHNPIAATPKLRGERWTGWIAHYVIGIGFALLLPLLWGPDWIRQPALGPALTVGIGTVAAPFLLMQPGMGAGLAARRTPNPARARVHSLLTHAIFGAGLYFAAWMLLALERALTG